MSSNNFPPQGGSGSGPQPPDPEGPEQQSGQQSSQNPFPTMGAPKGPRQKSRSNRVSRTFVVVVAACVFVLLAGGSLWIASAWSTQGAGDEPEAAALPTASNSPMSSSSARESGADSSGDSPTPSETSSPSPTDPQQIAKSRLDEESKTDTQMAKSDLAGKWVPQVGSKRKGMKFAGMTWTYQDIWKDFDAIQEQYPNALLLWSGDWKSYESGNYWVTVIDEGFTDPDDALDWCRSNGLDGEHCYAKRLSNSHGPDGSSKQQ